MTLLALILVGGLAFYVIARPMWQYVRQPWAFDAPDGKEEQIRQEQLSALESLRDLAMDYRLGQLSMADYRALAAPLQKQARRTLQQQNKQARMDDDSLAAFDSALEAEILALRRIKPIANGHAATGARTARFCPQCGEAINATDRFCAGCGTKLPEPKPTEPEPAIDVVFPVQSNGQAAEQPQSAMIDPASDIEATPDLIDAEIQNPSPKTPLEQPSPPSATLPNASPRAAYRWWGIAAVIVAAWVVGVIWLSMNSRAGQEAQSPVATLPVGQIQALAVVDDVALIGASDGIQRSTDNESWNALPMDDTILSLAVLDENSRLAAGGQGLWQSDDSGAQWQRVATDPAALRLVALSSVPGEAGLVWGADHTRLYLSHDGGLTWGIASTSLPGQPRALAAGNGDLFIGTNRGVYLSRNRGASWIDYNGSVNGRIGTTDIQTVAYDPTGNIIFAGTSMGLFFMNLASPGGWGQRALKANVTALAVTGNADEELWVGTAGGQLFRSTTRGVTWQ